MVAGLLTVWGGYRAPHAQSTQKPMPSLLIESLFGRDLYASYCAGCHGRDGKGDGPVARALNTPPTDLTTIARRNGGQFRASIVAATLNGTRPIEPSSAHGSSEMPIWGSIFRQLDAKETVANTRVDNLVKYVESIQVR
jgi:mono/diheme cytochrome c family protein